MHQLHKIACILLGTISVPIIISIISINSSISITNEDATIQKYTESYGSNGESYTREYYYEDEYLCSNTYPFDSVTFTQKNYAKIQWVSFNATHYQLNISLSSKERTPSGYILIFESNRFSYNLSVTIDTDVFTVNKTNVDSRDSFVITYITLENMEKLTINIDLECSNTHNSDSGDKTVYSEKKFDVIVADPTHNDDLANMFTLLTGISILSILGLIVTMGILVKKGMN